MQFAPHSSKLPKSKFFSIKSHQKVFHKNDSDRNSQKSLQNSSLTKVAGFRAKVKLQMFLRLLTSNSYGDFTKQFFSNTNFDEIASMTARHF